MASTRSQAIHTHWRISRVLTLLVLACILPGILSIALLIGGEYQTRREQLNDNLISTARAMVQSIDSQLLSTQALAQLLASFGGIEKSDLPSFHQWASEVIAETGLGLNAVLTDPGGQQVLNTLASLGDPLPMHGDQQGVRQVFETGQPYISGLYTSGYLRLLGVHISVPVWQDDQVICVLTVGVLAEEFNEVLEAQNFPADWVGVVFDGSGTIVARTHSPEIFVGQKGSPDYIRNIAETLEGTFEGVSREGIPLSSVWSRSATTNWSVGIGIPSAALEQELLRGMLWLALAVVVSLGTSLILAWQVSKRIAASVQSLKAPALAMAEGEVLPEPPVMIEEVAQVGSAIHQAATLLKRRRLDLELAQRTNLRELERQVDERTQDLLQLNRKLEHLAMTDDLTSLSNRKAAYTRLRQEFLRLKRSGNGYAVLFLDIDHFKSINDTYGHETGDQVLRQLATILHNAVRQTDLVSRHGGEEFMVLLHDTHLIGALTLAEKIRVAVAAHEFPLVLRVTVSIGVTTAAGEDHGEEDAVRRADDALYQAKAEGRNRVCSRPTD